MIRNLSVVLIGLLCCFSTMRSFGQDQKKATKEKLPIKVDYEFKNMSEGINDGVIQLKIEGGTPPYTYHWSENHVPKTSSVAHALSEGESVSVMVEDAEGRQKNFVIDVPVKSLPEIINGAFIPIVEFLDKIIFWDPFAILGLHDPIAHDADGNVLYHPNGTPVKQSIPFIVVWLGFGALFFTIKLRLINFRGFKHAIDLLRGHGPQAKKDKSESGEVNHFQALATALSGTVGLGNIAGVAVAVSIGGPGATFWMIATGLLAMASKFVECTLGVKYRKNNPDGSVSGGPMYYLKDGLAKRGKVMKYVGIVLAGLFAFLTVGGSFGIGNMFQANQAFSQLAVIVPAVSSWGPYFGVFLALLVGAVIMGGIQGISKVAERIVPLMAVVYLISALAVIILKIEHIGEAFSLIINGAFNPGALKGGIIGVFIVGLQRAAFSNEAGIGSAAIAHSAVKTDKPVTEGFVSLLEPFIATVVICTSTALVIIFTGVYDNAEGLEGAELTSRAFSSVFSWYPYLLLVIIFLFAFSTMISWSYYGLKAFDYLFGGVFEKLGSSRKVSSNVYRFIFLFFIVVGSSSELGSVLDFSDMMILAMSFPNLIGMYLLRNEVYQDMKDYMNELKAKKSKALS